MPKPSPHTVTPEDLEACAREAIHQIALVQPHGFVVACDRDTGTLAYHSDNLARYLTLVHQTPVALQNLTDEAPDQLLLRLGQVAPGPPQPFALSFRAELGPSLAYETSAHRVGPHVVLEVLPYTEAPPGGASQTDVDRLEAAVRGLGSLNRQQPLGDFLRGCSDELRRISGYDRVMIYRFLPDWCGEVIAESCAEGTQQRFLGLRFPASDIPPQARELYRHNLLRVIADVQAQPAALTIGEPGLVPDHSHSLLRQPSSMHLRYLQNMGIRATMTISLLKDGQLWGMVACHHHQPKAPPRELRRLTQLLSALVAETTLARLDAMQQRNSLERHVALKSGLERVMRTLSAASDFDAAALQALHELCPPLQAQAFGFRLDDRWVVQPQVPEALLQTLHAARARQPADQALVVDMLQDLAGAEAADWLPWSGAMMVSLPNLPGSQLLLLRQEQARVVYWAGAPDKAVQEDINGTLTLGPRASFDQWRQVVSGRSEPWSADERVLAEDIAKVLSESAMVQRSRALQSDLRVLASCMERLNDMIIITDTTSVDDGGPRILYVNDAFVAVTGYSREDVLGRTPHLLQGPETDRSVTAEIRQAMAGWKPITVELINYRRDGEPYWVELNVAPISDGKGWYTHWVAIARPLDERKQAEKSLQRLEHHDALTGLPNRRLLDNRLQAALTTCDRFGNNGALLYLDVDDFKSLNDSAGHAVGDELLRQVAARLTAAVRREDTVARLGGDEFVVLLGSLSSVPNEAAATCRHVAQELVARLAQPYELSDRVWTGSVSLGVALFDDASDEQRAYDPLKYAEVAMYQAKAAGRNTWRQFDRVAQRRHDTRAQLRQALGEGMVDTGFDLRLQPLLDEQMAPVGMVGTLLWQHPEQGWQDVAELLDDMQSPELLRAATAFVLHQACERLSAWAAQDDQRHFTLTVPLGNALLQQPDLDAQLHSALAGCQVVAHRLVLLLSELPPHREAAPALAALAALEPLGVRVALAHCATRPLPIADLPRLPLAALYLDADAACSIADDGQRQLVWQGLQALARALGAHMVVSDVQRPTDLEWLRSHGCQRFTGGLAGARVSIAS